ncbi:hypothetical protein C8F04DRAFT_1406335 [Mycena alexandri]|uniref:ARM repeat superfamily protein n=1 Tax=Mycena alexandri TaxID=1745969 RepID=A0AAD6WQC8_9AGAR|nr:hypothetical protein C8F04DRAFT_1406335 [Mycena alexandri]
MSTLDVAHAIALIQAAYAPSSSTGTSSAANAIQNLQSTLLAAQRTPAAWALVVPLLSHPDPNVQFFGAHTAHAKIARGELSSLSEEEQVGLREALVQLAGVQGRTRVVRRKVYSAVVALAVRVVGGDSSASGTGSREQWWLEGTVNALAAAGAPSAHIHEFLAGAAEDVGSASLLPQPKIRIEESLRAAAQLVLQSISAVLASAVSSLPNPQDDADALPAALACLVAWLPNRLLPQEGVAALVPGLISLLSSNSNVSRDAASTTLAELLARPPAAWGPGVLLEPLTGWVRDAFGEYASPSSVGATPDYAGIGGGRDASEKLKTHARLLLALAESGVEWVAAHLVDVSTISTDASAAQAGISGVTGQGRSRGELAQTLVRVMLALTAADPGGARLKTSSTPGGSGSSFGHNASSAFGSSAFASSSTSTSAHSGSAGFANVQNGASFAHDATNGNGNGVQDADSDDDEDDWADEEDGIPPGGPLAFWFALQEALWEVDVANAYLYPSHPSSSSFPTSSSSSASFPQPSTPMSAFPAPAFPSSPLSPGADMDDEDPEHFRGRGGVGGTPWTPGANSGGGGVHGRPGLTTGGGERGSYAFASTPISPPAFGRQGSSGFGFPGTGGGAGGDAFTSFASTSTAAWAAQQEQVSPFEADADVDALKQERESGAEKARTAHARAAYVALVRILRGKVVCGRGWGRERLEQFSVYRRDVGDTMVNAYYVLRDDLLTFLVADAAAGLEARRAWETIEAPLHCLRAVHEALDLDSTPTTSSAGTPSISGTQAALARLFGGEVWGRLPAASGNVGAGSNGQRKGEAVAVMRIRRTALGLVDTYANYFTTRAPDALLPPLQYVLGALADPDPGICLQAALALRSLCDANRRALAGRISAFAEVHAGLGGVPDSEKGKVLQSIASVIQALPPVEAIAPVEAMVGPILQRLGEALGGARVHPDPARFASILQLEILSGVAKGLTRTSDPMSFDEEESGGEEANAVRAAREDPRTGALRAALFDAIAQVAELWSADAEVGQALSELFKAITALPADVTLLSLPAGPLLGVVCRAAGRRLTGVWLALATILIAQLNPPPLLLTLKSGPSEEAEACVRQAVGQIVGAALAVLGVPGGMVENPDIVQEFFACMDRVAQDFTAAFCALPDGAFDALMQCAISALSLQERYSLVAACTFLGTLVHRTALFAPISPELLQQLQAHLIRTHGRAIMRAVLWGFAGAAPRSVTSNLLELLSALVSRWDERAVTEAEGEMREGRAVGGGARGWVAGIVLADDFFPSRAGQDAKERFVKTVVSSRSVRKTKEAANQFTIVAWGLEGSTFGYSSASSV